jgi:hypothetical protein
MNTEPDSLTPADEETYKQVISLLGKDRLLGGIEELFIARIEPLSPRRPQHKFLIARIQNENCINELCPTLIISNGSQGDKILFSAYLPARMGRGDSCFYLCSKCECVEGIYFQGNNGLYYQFGLSGEYAVFGVNNFKGQ